VDSGNPSKDIDKTITINVNDKNDPPHDVEISNSDVMENAPPNTLVGVISGKDEDAGQTLSYTLLDDDNDNFILNSVTGQLYKKNPANYESKLAHHIVVEVSDNAIPPMKVSISLHFEYFKISLL